MMADTFIHAAHQAEYLLKDCPRQAASLLARLYREDSVVRSEIDSILLLHIQSERTAPQSAPRSSRITTATNGRAHGHGRSSSSQCSTSPNRQRASTVSDDRSTPLSPRSTGSRSTRGSSTTGEYILIIDVTEDSEEQPVRMKSAKIEHSLIREDIALRRIKSTEPIQEDEFQTFVPSRRQPNAFEEVSVSQSIELTWRRKKSSMTHRTTFFLVREDLLDTDVILGFQDSGEYDPGYPITFTSQPQYPRGYMQERYHQQMQPPAPTPQIAVDDHSFHRSEDPTRDLKQPSGFQRAERHAAQQMPQRSQTEHRHQVPSSAAPTIRGNPSSYTQHSQPQQTPLVPTTSASDRNFDAPERRLRLKLRWDATIFSVWLNLDDPAQAFFLALQQQFRKRRPILDRTLMTIYLKPQEQSQDEIAKSVSLDPDDLDADWTDTVLWLEANKQEKPPHIYGTVEVDGG